MVDIRKPPNDENMMQSARASERWILAATILGSSMAFIDGTVVNVALPALQKTYNATVVDVQWVVEAYALFLGALLLTGGSMGDRFGRRRVFCWGVALFALASLGCGLAQSIGQLIAALAGCRRGAACARKSCHHRRVVQRGAARPRYRHVVRFHRDYDCHRSGYGRMVDRACILAGGFFY
jgi:predicted MFS family arabinose efflux permease